MLLVYLTEMVFLFIYFFGGTGEMVILNNSKL
jgi:hypothetical protein